MNAAMHAPNLQPLCLQQCCRGNHGLVEQGLHTDQMYPLGTLPVGGTSVLDPDHSSWGRDRSVSHYWLQPLQWIFQPCCQVVLIQRHHSLKAHRRWQRTHSTVPTGSRISRGLRSGCSHLAVALCSHLAYVKGRTSGPIRPSQKWC